MREATEQGSTEQGSTEQGSSEQRSTEPAAAVDLGSNSFHLLVARFENGQLQVLDRLKERVQLAAGLSDDKQLEPETRARALACLERFGQLIRHLPASRVSAVGTSTMRQLRDSGRFAADASLALGHAIEVISGPEEARLIHVGVVHTMPSNDEARLVVDIGGGSTECVVGRGTEMLLADSLHMGCVAYSRRYFEGGKLSQKRFQRAERAALLELSSMRERYRASGFRAAVGCSGTILAISTMLRASRLTNGEITLAGLEHLKQRLLLAKHLDKLSLAGLDEDRKNSIAGGLCILRSVFEALSVVEMVPSDAALREGVLFELGGGEATRDIRQQTVSAMMTRYAVDVAQAERVARTAQELFAQVASSWELDARHAKLLAWGAKLHEVGLALSHGSYHKHGEYLIRHSVLAGFSRDAQDVVAALVRAHRRKIDPGVLEPLPLYARKFTLRLAALLRIARKLNRARSTEPAAQVRVKAKKHKLKLWLPAALAEERPVTALDLQREPRELAKLGLELVLKSA